MTRNSDISVEDESFQFLTCLADDCAEVSRLEHFQVQGRYNEFIYDTKWFQRQMTENGQNFLRLYESIYLSFRKDRIRVHGAALWEPEKVIKGILTSRGPYGRLGNERFISMISAEDRRVVAERLIAVESALRLKGE